MPKETTMTLITADRRARVLLAGALVAGALGLSAAQADAAYTPAVKDRTLLLAGDAAADKLALRTAATKLPTLEVDVGDDGSADFRITLSSFDRIRVLAGDGADTVRVRDVPLPVTVDGGAGGDRLEVNGLGGDDTIDSTLLSAARLRVRADGGAGNDVLLGGDGDDVLSGGDGADVIFAGSGDNVAFGGAGDDVLRGEEGDDFLDGGAGDDILIGNAGDDILLNGEVVFDD
jgi:Ca2+-binding RTX toxin-like protein